MAVLVDANVFMWVSKKKILGGNYGAAALLSVTNSALSLAGEGIRVLSAAGVALRIRTFSPQLWVGISSEPTSRSLTPFCANRAI